MHRWLKAKLNLLDFDQERARLIVASLEPEPGSGLTAEGYRLDLLDHCLRLANGDGWFTVDAYGRVHTPLTSLHRELRCCLSVGGQPLAAWDLKNSQPLMAGLLARRFYGSADARKRLQSCTFADRKRPYHANLLRGLTGSKGMPADVVAYVKCCEQGGFYESFTAPGGDRDATKRRFWPDVFFGKPFWRGPLRARFEERYPSLGEMLRVLKRKTHARPAWLLQNLEATIFIGAVCGRIMEEKRALPLLTIHDMLLCPPEDANYVREIVLHEFAKLGISPQLKLEFYR